MEKAILAKKIGMMQIFEENGIVVPVTVLEAGPCTVVQKKTVEKDGYTALQVGFGTIRPKQVNKPMRGHYEKHLDGANAQPNRVLKELKLDDIDKFEIGSEIKADIFVAGDQVDISGVSKGKGYQGAIKRHGLRTGPRTHGSKYHRGLGSMGPGTTPGSVKKGKRMSGHMGARNTTVQNLQVVRIDAEKNLLMVKGAVPGPRNGLVVVKSTVKK